MSEAPAVPTPVFTELSARRLGPLRRFLVRRPVVVDVGLVLAFVGWALVVGVGADSMYSLRARLGDQPVDRIEYASLTLTLVGAAALVRRRRRPLPVALVMGALGVLALALTGTTSGIELGIGIALYALAASAPPRVTWSAAAVTVGAVLVAARVLPLPATVGAVMLNIDPSSDDPALAQARGETFLQSTIWYRIALPVLVIALLAVAVGASVRNRRLHLAAFVEAANALARDQDQRERLALAAERARIAREMHDVVAHSISVMVALGGGAAVALDWAPDRSRAALDDLVATGRAALGDMRRVLGVLHDDDARGRAETPEDGVPLAPQPGGVDLSTLVERFRTAGLPVRTTGVADALDGLDASLQLAVYRIVQESLTNALRHAPGTPAVDVALCRGADGVEVVVTDAGPTLAVVASPGTGRGLVGMQERVAVFGGTVEAGPHGRGWRVRALLAPPEEDA